jgi:iron(II)-dependent oxidoreductase
MAGNVYGRVGDWYGENYYASSPARDPTGPASGQYRVLRGGSWRNEQRYVRAAYRDWLNPDDRGADLGFRCARSP